MSAQVSVLVPCYGDAHLVGRVVARILEGSRCDLEVVLVNNDDNQAAQIRALVKALGDERVRLLELEHGAGFARGINAGIKATTAELVFFANSDLFVSDGYVDELVSFFARHPRASCATGKILRYDLEGDLETNIIDTTGLTIGRDRRVADRGENEADTGRFEREEEVFGVSGAALVARRAALEDVAVGGEYLDESFHMYKEDIDLSWRFRLAGWECWYVPSAVAHHGRTVHGLGRRSYLADMRRFHENEQAKPILTRMNSMRNHWLLLLKNEDLSNFLRDAVRILGREALVLGYNVVSSPADTMTTLASLLRTIPEARLKRRTIKRRQHVSPAEVRRWFTPRTRDHGAWRSRVAQSSDLGAANSPEERLG
jgi:GT2 family glycosyltransferase